MVKIQDNDDLCLLRQEAVPSRLTYLQLIKVLESLPFLILTFDSDRTAIDIARISTLPDQTGKGQCHVCSLTFHEPSELIDSEILKGSVARPGVCAQLAGLSQTLPQPEQAQLETALAYLLTLAFPEITLVTSESSQPAL